MRRLQARTAAASRLMALRRPPEAQRAAFDAIGADVLARSATLQGRSFSTIGATDLRAMWEAYDARVFDGALGALVGRDIGFDVSDRMTSAGGTTRWHKREGFVTLSLSRHLLLQTFQDEEREIRVGGCVCHDRLAAAQRIFEHELCHVVEFLATDRSACSKAPFQDLAHGLFGHSDHRHTLVTPREKLHADRGIALGSAVRFRLDGQSLTGFVQRVGKTATVFVEDPQGPWRDARGRRLQKYRVPLDRLERVEPG